MLVGASTQGLRTPPRATPILSRARVPCSTSSRGAVGGGVAANGELRRGLAGLGADVHVPPAVLCTDNAAMIASAGRYCAQLSYPDYLGLDAYATGERPR